MKKNEELPRGIRIRNGSYYAFLTHPDGKGELRSVGRVGIITAKWANEQRVIWQRQIQLGAYERRKPRVKQILYTCGDLWEPYLRDYSNRGGKDAGRLEIAWNRLKPIFEKMPVEEVSTDSINKYIESRLADGLKGATVNRETSLLQAMFRHGTRITPPMVKTPPAFPCKLKESKPRQGFITDKEYAVLAANARDLWLRAFIACAYNFGFRKGELLGLHVGQVDFLGGWIELREGETKNGEGRKVKMTQEVKTLLLECCQGKKPADYVFTREAGARVVDPRDEWYSLCVSSGLGHWIPAKQKNGEQFKAYRGLNLHDFRRSAIRNMTRRGVSDVVAMKISGHKTASVFKRYNIVDERDLEQASRLIEAGASMPQAVVETDTKSDTAGFSESPDSRNSLN